MEQGWWQEVVEWRRPVESGFILSGGVILYLLVEYAEHSIVSLVMKGAVLAMLLSVIHKLYLDNHTPKKEFPVLNCERAADTILDWVTPRLAGLVDFSTRIVTWQDWWQTTTVLSFSFLLSWLGSLVSVSGLLILMWISFFALPFLWEKRDVREVQVHAKMSSPPLLRTSPPRPSPQSVPLKNTPVHEPVRVSTPLPSPPMVYEQRHTRDMSPPQNIITAPPRADIIRPFGEGTCPITSLPYCEGAVRGINVVLAACDRVLFHDMVLRSMDGDTWDQCILLVTLEDLRLIDPAGGCPGAFPFHNVDKITRDVLSDHATSELTVTFVCPAATLRLQLPTTPASTLLGVCDLILRQNLPPPAVFAQLAMAQAKLDSRTPTPMY
eukprot:TRINITY_DN27570_c0_g1_i1.p1 TRINITY_DN27570_c0_g1~~TRINITY_DN27570_c0_g1_i1.p1  ORF type:complete len:389 (+),score=78.68 TRINITY_DN27570_c0_g1_i1:27-1169(+)